MSAGGGGGGGFRDSSSKGMGHGAWRMQEPWLTRHVAWWDRGP